MASCTRLACLRRAIGDFLHARSRSCHCPSARLLTHLQIQAQREPQAETDQVQTAWAWERLCRPATGEGRAHKRRLQEVALRDPLHTVVFSLTYRRAGKSCRDHRHLVAGDCGFFSQFLLDDFGASVAYRHCMPGNIAEHIREIYVDIISLFPNAVAANEWLSWYL